MPVRAAGVIHAEPKLRKYRGRPKSFDADSVLDAAMVQFWRHGYEATSLADLTRAMGVTAPSIYAAFGDKRGLFLAAVDRYLKQSGTGEDPLTVAPDARTAARAMLDQATIRFTGTETPPGCLLASAAIACSEKAADVGTLLADYRRATGKRLEARIADDVATGALPASTDVEGLSGLVMTTVFGLSTMARDGTPRWLLQNIVDTMMRAFPEPPSA